MRGWIWCLALLLAACGGSSAEPGSAACVEGATWRGHFYEGVGVPADRQLERGDRVNGGAYPGCDDAGEYDNAPERDNDDVRADLYAVRGVVPEIALVSPRAKGVVYLAPGFLTQLETHPLFDVLYSRSQRRIDVRRRKRCRRRGEVTERLQPGPVTPRGLFLVDGQEVFVLPETRVIGRRRHGVPYFQGGDLITARGSRCRSGGLIARSLMIG